MKGRLAPRYWVLWLGLAVTFVSLVLGLTPWWYDLERRFFGVPDEYYPELAWLSVAGLIGVPMIGVGTVIVLITRRRSL